MWLALHFLGRPVGITTALLIESLGQVVRSSAFAVPGALGVQEAGYLLLGRTVDLGPETSLALSLVQRMRDLILGLPGLLAWWLVEFRPRAARRMTAADGEATGRCGP